MICNCIGCSLLRCVICCIISCPLPRCVIYCIDCSLLKCVIYCIGCSLLRYVIYCIVCWLLRCVIIVPGCSLLRCVIYCGITDKLDVLYSVLAWWRRYRKEIINVDSCRFQIDSCRFQIVWNVSNFVALLWFERLSQFYTVTFLPAGFWDNYFLNYISLHSGECCRPFFNFFGDNRSTFLLS